MKIVIRTPRYERLSTSPNTSSEVTSFLAVEGIGPDKNCVTLIGKTLGGDGIKIKCLEMRSVYPLPDTNLSCANYYQPLFLVFRKWLARRS